MNKPPYWLHATPPTGLDFTQLFMDVFSADLRRTVEAHATQPTKKPCEVIAIDAHRRPAAPVRSAHAQPKTQEVTCSPSTCPSLISVD